MSLFGFLLRVFLHRFVATYRGAFGAAFSLRSGTPPPPQLRYTALTPLYHRFNTALTSLYYRFNIALTPL